MIDVKDVEKQFANGKESIHVLDHISFQVQRGEIVTLLGKSGCGKSTLLNMVGGFEKADGGAVILDGKDVKRPSRKCTMLFQQINLLPWRNVLKNVELGLEGESFDAEEKNKRVMDALNLVGLEQHLQQFPSELSGGMQQRVAIARALAMQPDVILMDEPFAALDTFNRYLLQDELIRIQAKSKTTMLIVTHDIDEAVYLSDRILIMSSHPGRIFKDISIHLSKPRDRASEDFHYYRRRILNDFELSGKQQEPEYVI
ncbi:ATP-binding cassette domain-containing protein [Bacillus sp. B15-48]|nr:ABC transporter ATP-binding protein [Bacillus sp. B15-48]MBM4762935.1 ATP-binding cassette domain-containing protein [Bacillus sp. B15-48]